MQRPDPNDAEFQAIYQRHFDAVARYCIRRLPDSLAQEAAAEVFVTAWRRFDSVPSGDATLPWLYGVARNAVRNADRTQRRATRLSARMNAQPRRAQPSAETQVVRKEEDDELLAALVSLRPDDQEILRLRAYEGLSMSQIAVAVGCSEEAAKKRVARALVRLRKAAAVDTTTPFRTQPQKHDRGGER